MTNHIMLDMKFRAISYFGRVDGLQWNGLILLFICLSTDKYLYVLNIIHVEKQKLK